MATLVKANGTVFSPYRGKVNTTMVTVCAAVYKNGNVWGPFTD